MNQDVIFGINGPVVTVQNSRSFSMMEQVYVGNSRLVGEVIKISDQITTIQVYEDTDGLRIYEDVRRQNETLVLFLAKRQNATATSALLNATDNRTLNKGGIVGNAMSRWQESRLAVRGSQPGGNGSGGNGGDGDETVNRGK